MHNFKVLISVVLALGLSACSIYSENMKMGVVQLNAAAHLIGPHNASHCALYIVDLEKQIAETEDGAEKDALIADLTNERIYLRANELLPTVTEEIENLVFERETEEKTEDDREGN